jgi:flagellar protein FliO/FliZ
VIELALRVLFSLAIVVGLLLLVARFAGRRFRGKPGSVVQVLHRQQLSRGSSVAVVTVSGRVLVLGMTEHQVTLLSELDPVELEEAGELLGTTPEPMPVPVPQTPRPATGSHRANVPADVPTENPAGVPGPVPGALAGSVLSPQTWRQALAAVSGQRSS